MYIRSFGFSGRNGNGKSSFVSAGRDSGVDSSDGRAGGVVGSLGQTAGVKRRRVFGANRSDGPDESPILPDPAILRRRLDFK